MKKVGYGPRFGPIFKSTLGPLHLPDFSLSLGLETENANNWMPLSYNIVLYFYAYE